MKTTVAVHCAVHPAVDGPRSRQLVRQLMAMIGFPFSVGALGAPEPDAAARVVVRPPEAAVDDATALDLTLASPWSDPSTVRVTWRDDLPLLFAAGPKPDALLHGTRVVVDVLGALEFLLGGEERLTPSRDERGRFRAAYSVLDDLGLGYVAVLDRYAAHLRDTLGRHAPQLPAVRWGNDACFLVALTHDVDGLFGTRPQPRKALHYLRAGLSARSGLALEEAATESLRVALRPHVGPAEFNFGRWIAVERQLGVRSTLHFFSDYEAGRDVDDAWYAYRERGRLDGQAMSLGRAIGALAVEGFEIGVHTSISSFGDTSRVARERLSVERAAQAPVISARSHHLRFDPERSAEAFLSAGLRNDSSVSGLGFVRGSGFPYVTARAPGGELLELPTVIQDDHLLKDWRMGAPRPVAERKVDRVLGELRDHGGGAAILFHPDQEEKISLYTWIIEWVDRGGGRCVTARELAEAWRERSTPVHET